MKSDTVYIRGNVSQATNAVELDHDIPYAHSPAGYISTVNLSNYKLRGATRTVQQR